MVMTMATVTLTPFPTDEASSALPSAGLGDRRVELEVPVGFSTPKEWGPVPGTPFEARQASCGARCECAAEIRLAQEGSAR